MKALLAITIALAAHDARAFQCRETHSESHVLTTATKLPIDGGIVTGQVVIFERENQPVSLDWHATNAQATTLAPGLIVYRARDRSKPIAITNGGTTARATLGDTYGTELAAPAITNVMLEPPDEVPGSRVTVTLATPAPAGAIALILYDRRSRARAWAPISAKATTLKIYDDTCGTLPLGLIEPAIGEDVAFAFVDDAGRPSPKSAAVRVTAHP